MGEIYGLLNVHPLDSMVSEVKKYFKTQPRTSLSFGNGSPVGHTLYAITKLRYKEKGKNSIKLS